MTLGYAVFNSTNAFYYNLEDCNASPILNGIQYFLIYFHRTSKVFSVNDLFFFNHYSLVPIIKGLLLNPAIEATVHH